MAVQFPNFLGVPVRTPDYSAVGDIFENYYKGRAMPKDDLIKAIQAEFARPIAEQSLLSSRLSNRRSQMELNKMARDAQIEAENARLLRQAISGNLPAPNTQPSNLPVPGAVAPAPQQATGGFTPVDYMQMIATQQPKSYDPIPRVRELLAQEQGVNAGAQEPMQGFDPSKMDKRFVGVDQAATGLPASAYKPKPDITSIGVPMPQAQAGNVPQQNVPQQVQSDEIVLQKGAPHLAGIDQLWESRPDMHKYLESRGYKKSQEIKTDAKSGRTTIKTVYPSGTVTLKTIGRPDTGEGIPLTNAMVTEHQEVIKGVDNVIPILEQILALGGGEIVDEKGMPAGKNKDVLQPYPLKGYTPFSMGNIPGWMSDAADYDTLVTSAAEPLVKALGYPGTDKGIEKAVKQVITTGGERNYRYIQRIRRLIQELKNKKAYSEKALKMSNKISPVDTGAGGYSSNEWETA